MFNVRFLGFSSLLSCVRANVHVHVCAVVRVWSYVLCVVLRSNITIILTKHAYVLASRLPLFSPSSPPRPCPRPFPPRLPSAPGTGSTPPMLGARAPKTASW